MPIINIINNNDNTNTNANMNINQNGGHGLYGPLRINKILYIVYLIIGFMGIQRFKRHQRLLGMVYLFTFGLLFVGWAYDVYQMIIRYNRNPQSMYFDFDVAGHWIT